MLVSLVRNQRDTLLTVLAPRAALAPTQPPVTNTHCMVVAVHTSVTRAYLGDAMFEELKPDANAAEVQRCREEWLDRARRFVCKRKREGDPGDAIDQARLKREKAYRWIVVLNQVLRSMTGKTLDYWKRPDDGEEDPSPCVYSWPYLGIAADQGSDGMSASFFLRWGQAVNAEFWWGPSHGVWRDQEAALKQCGLRSFTYLMCAVYNMQHSPWDSQARSWQMRQSTDEYLRHMSDSCPLLAEMLPKILADWEYTEPIDSDVMHWAMDQLKIRWANHHVGSNVKMCRFANFVDKARTYDKDYHWTALRVVYLGLQEAIFTSEKLEKAAGSLRRPAARVDEGGERVAVAQSNEEIRAWRDANRNTVQLAAQMLLETSTHNLTRLVERFTRPIREWHGDQSHRLRDTESFRAWIVRQVRGDMWSQMKQTLALLSDTGALQHIGFDMGISTTELWQYGVDHPEVAASDGLASSTGAYAFSLVSARASRLMYLWAGWTGLQCLFVSDDDEAKKHVVDLLAVQANAHEAVAARTEVSRGNCTRGVCSRHRP